MNKASIDTFVQETRKVQIPFSSQLDVTEHTLHNVFDFPVDAEIGEDGVLYENEEFSGSHRWTEKKAVRKATDTDRALITIFKELHKAKFK